ncbi:MAG: ferredoxin [Microbacteriaceae bacterium]|nr:ferredoxin [Microbacteriaceae bacterium]MCL2793831.1 ferredoxin [Microbacteriaceae bacterium]
MSPAEPTRDTALLHIDWTRCDGRGLCAELLAEILDRDEWGYPIARPGVLRDGDDPSDIPVHPSLRAAAEQAVAMCPLAALRLTTR